MNDSNNSKNKFPEQGNFSSSQNENSNQNNTQNDYQKEKQLNLKENARNEVAKEGIKEIANAYAGPLGREAADAIMKTKLGNELVNKTTKLSKQVNPGQRLGDFFKSKLNPKEDTESEESNEDTEEIEANEEDISSKVRSKIVPISILATIGCFGGLILVVIIVTIMLGPIFYVGSMLKGVTSIWDNIVYFFKGCKNEAECVEKEKNSFYETLLEVHDKYEKEYKVTLNTELITATLTYYDPMSKLNEIEDIEDIASNMVDFKKSRKKIDELASHMTGTGKRCVNSKGIAVASYKEEEKDKECPVVEENINQDETQGETQSSEKVLVQTKEIPWYYIDEDKYKKYLEDTFISKYYFNNKKDAETNKKVSKVIEEIYSRVEMVKYLNGSKNSSNSFVTNNSKVLIMDCSGNIQLGEISLYEYLQGVLYLEGYATNRSEEFLKVQAIISKNYLYALNGATPDSIPTTLKIRSCQMNQVYCSVTDGCHNLNDGNDPNNYDSYDSIAMGPDSNGEFFRQPLTDVAALERIKVAIDSTLKEFLVKDDKFVFAEYRSDCSNLGISCDSSVNRLDQKIANDMVTNGSTYKDVLNVFYDATIEEITFGMAGYPLDLVYNNITSAFGWRVNPTGSNCKHHNGTDIGAPADANIYSIADGVVVANYFSTSYGNVTEIGHGEEVNGVYEYYSLYAHQIRLSNYITVGSKVNAGQLIGNVGSTGDSTGNHLHIEIYTIQNGSRIKSDALEYFKGVKLIGEVGGTLYNSESSCESCINTRGVNACR